MKKIKDYLILFTFLLLFIMIFKYNNVIKMSVISSCELWFLSLVPFMFPMYIIVDLLLNYGISNFLYKLFKKNTVILVLISMVAGTPSSAKYIKEFYNEGLISQSTGNYLLMVTYFPNPLFILGVLPSTKVSIILLSYIYLSNFMIALIFRNRFDLKEENIKTFKRVSFAECIENSVFKSFNVLILILGIVTIYGILNDLLALLDIDSVFLSSILELTNAIDIILEKGVSLLWVFFAVAFGGLSIHTQIKSILESTPLNYRYFLIGRLIASVPMLFFVCIY